VKETPPPHAKTRLRRLSADEIELWRNVTKTIARRQGATLPEIAPLPKTAKLSEAPKPTVTPRAITVSKAAPESSNGTRPPTGLAPLERRLVQKLARGRVAPDAVIDLHGMSRQEAFVALRGFLSHKQREGAKLVLVVTGKGERSAGIDGEPGILRKSVPHWLHGPDYRSLVAGFEEASRSHGGTGALYVRIRRHDKAER
jgi:DNA-nicking Smr family endonuclease